MGHFVVVVIVFVVDKLKCGNDFLKASMCQYDSPAEEKTLM